MNMKIILALIATAVVATALVGVSAAQFANQTQNTLANGQVERPCLTGDSSLSCINPTTGEPYCYENGTYTGSCNCIGAQDGGHQNGYCSGYGYGCGQEEQYQYQYRHGGCGRFW
ncbi:MAG: hypothetical protein ACQCN4_07085 [Candidatus Bathyarchaeia archaeon]|jgi:hypothetical protein